MFAQFTYIRYNARCVAGKVSDDCGNITPELLTRIPRDPFYGRIVFGASITEQLWSQRLSFPNCPIPLILPGFADILFQKGARTAEGVFRLSGMARSISEFTAALNAGGDPKTVLERATVHDVAQLIKLWFMSLPGRIITPERAGALQTEFEKDKSYIQFMESLPLPEQLSAKYVIGLIQDLLKNEQTTKMGVSNFAIVLGPVMVSMGAGGDQALMMKFNRIAQEFVSFLLENWDTSDIYPLPEDCFRLDVDVG
jgi:hypothetical protein